MAKLKVVLNLDRIPGGSSDLQITFPRIEKLLTGLGEDFVMKSQSVVDVEEVISFGDVSSPGYMLVVNIGTAEDVLIGLTASYSVRIPPGGFAFFPVEGTLYAVSGSANAATFTYYLFSA